MLVLREATDMDCTVLKGLYRCFVDEMSRLNADDSNSDEEIMSWIETSLAGKDGVIWVAENGEGVSGFARVQRKKRISENGEAIDYAKLNDLYVVPEARGKGVARLLMKASIGWAENARVCEMILNVYENNEAARRLYQAFGFTQEGVISANRIRMKFVFAG